MKLLPLLSLLFPMALFAQAADLERINFFPTQRHFLRAGVEHANARISVTPSNSAQKTNQEELQRFSLSFGRRISPSIILGTELDFSEDQRARTQPGVPSLEKRTTSGIYQVEIFSIFRLRPESKERGLIDLNLSYSPRLADRGIHGKRSFRFNTSDEITMELSHGLREDRWEFKTTVGTAQTFFGAPGPGFSSSSDYWATFGAQRRISKALFLNGSLGLVYQSRRRFEEPTGVRQEVQSGSGSLLNVGVKKEFAPGQLVELSYLLHRRGYFSKSPGENFDGSWTAQSFFLNYLLGFN